MTSSLQTMTRNYALALVDRIGEAKRAANRTGDPFELGRTSGFHLALHMLLNRALALGISPQEIGLEGIDPDDLA